MKSFFKIFFASFLALIVFSIISFFVMLMMVGSLGKMSADKPVGKKAVLVLDLNRTYNERKFSDPLAELMGEKSSEALGLFDLLRIIEKAGKDSAVKGIYVKCEDNPNGFATNEAIREALLQFRQNNKFVVAYGNYITQNAYIVASAADAVFCNPVGMVEWTGLSTTIPFFKTALDRLEIEPQIFYAGKFKSATEPLREYKMTEANKLQTKVWMDALYSRILINTSATRNIDTATLRSLADNGAVMDANEAFNHKLVDGLKYDDELQDYIREKLDIDEKSNINFVSLSRYGRQVNYRNFGKSKDRIAVIYAQGEINNGKGDQGEIGGEAYLELISKARKNKDIKAIVIRINSGGGSSLASEIMWREVALAKKEKPVVVSFGDIAASGGYYMACAADTIFTEAATITGSIGVFGIIPNFKGLLNNKLGVTFDGVKTGPFADMGNFTRPLTAAEAAMVQKSIDNVYHQFLSRVAEGRKMSIEQVDSLAQGRIWTGEAAVANGLADRIGNLKEAIDCAARMAELSDYTLREYPETKDFFQQLMTSYKDQVKTKMLKEELGEAGYRLYRELNYLNQSLGTIQARIPFDLNVR
ncbi:MAG TPA: signal peptide peptidase SppA [Parasegetibacter sp.]